VGAGLRQATYIQGAKFLRNQFVDEARISDVRPYISILSVTHQDVREGSLLTQVHLAMV